MAEVEFPTAEFVEGPGGVRVAVYEWGHPAGRPLLLIHGFAQCHLSFTPQLTSRLGERFRMIAYDLRGHGVSDKPEDPAAYQSPTAWGDELAAVMAAKRLQQPVLVGWSMGGRIIRQYLINHGDAALGGINFVGSRLIEAPETAGPNAWLHSNTRYWPLGRLVDTAIGFLDGCVKRPLSAPERSRALCYNMLMTAGTRDAVAGWRTDPEAIVAALRRVSVPVLISQGRHDRIILPTSAELSAAAIPHARLSWYDDCGHAPFIEDATRFNRELEAFALASFGRAI